MSKPKKVAASKARNNFSDLISKVEYTGQEFLIERYGEVVAKLMPVEKTQETTQTPQEEEPKEQAQPNLKEPAYQEVDRPKRLNLKPEADKTAEEDQAAKAKEREEKVKVIRKRIKLMLE